MRSRARRKRSDRLCSHHHSGEFDDVEHLRYAVVNLADEPTHGWLPFPEGELARRGDLKAHLVLNIVA